MKRDFLNYPQWYASVTPEGVSAVRLKLWVLTPRLKSQSLMNQMDLFLTGSKLIKSIPIRKFSS
jgi:hypothetical protein